MASTSLPILPVADDGSLPPLPLLRQWLREARDQGEVLGVERIPYGNRLLPQLAVLGDFSRLRMHRPDLPQSFIWACGEAQVQVDNPGGEAPGTSQPFYGELRPCAAGSVPGQQRERLMRRFEAVRLADAAAIIDHSVEADWRPALAALATQQGSVPPLRTKSNVLEAGPMRVWNPLPTARRCVVALPPDGEAAPWAVRDQHGRQHPLQVVEGPLGEEWLTEIPLGPLEVLDLVPHDQPVDSEHWQVSPACLDNGVVRAELNEMGEVVRLSEHGHFVDQNGPLVQALVNGETCTATPEIRVLEHGPCRGRLSISHEHPQGYLRIMYTLHAHEALLHCAVTWTAQGHNQVPVCLRHPLAWRQAQISCGSEALPWTCPPSQQPGQTRPQQQAVRWIQAQQQDQSFCLFSRRAISIAPDDLAVELRESANYALTLMHARDGIPPGSQSLITSVPGRHAGNAPVSPPLFHSDHPSHITYLWAGRPDGWAVELITLEQAGQHGSFSIYPHSPMQDVRLVDADGRVRHDCRRNKDGDGWLIPYQAHDILIIRMR